MYPRVSATGMVSITRVDTTGDLRYSRIYVSALDKSQEKDILKGLKSAAGYLRRELGAALRLRYTPELQFIADDSILTNSARGILISGSPFRSGKDICRNSRGLPAEIYKEIADSDIAGTYFDFVTKYVLFDDVIDWESDVKDYGKKKRLRL